MEKLDSVIVRLVLKMKEIVILMKSVKMVLLVDQTIVQIHLVSMMKLTVAILKTKEYKPIQITEKLKILEKIVFLNIQPITKKGYQD